MKQLPLILLFLLFLITVESAVFHPQDISSSLLTNRLPASPYLASVCCLTGHSNRYLLEWVLYHYLVGIEHFFIYDNNPPNASTQLMVQDLIDLGLVELIPWYTSEEGVPLTQHAMIDNCIKTRAHNQTRWIGVWDDDEFLRVEPAERIIPRLLLKSFFSGRRIVFPLHRVLNTAIHTNCSGIHLDRIDVGTNGLLEPNDLLVIESYYRIKLPITMTPTKIISKPLVDLTVIESIPGLHGHWNVKPGPRQSQCTADLSPLSSDMQGLHVPEPLVLFHFITRSLRECIEKSHHHFPVFGNRLSWRQQNGEKYCQRIHSEATGQWAEDRSLADWVLLPTLKSLVQRFTPGSS